MGPAAVGIGDVRRHLAVLLAEVWQPLRRRDYHALRSLSGVAPVTRRSGKTCVVVRRYACNKRLANALYHWRVWQPSTTRSAAADTERVCEIERLSNLKVESIAAGLRIRLDAKTVRVSISRFLSEAGYNLVDVAVGPFDL
jgi:hypothetical protein